MSLMEDTFSLEATIKVLICDDSALARKQLARQLPQCLQRSIEFAHNGEQALSMLAQNNFQLLFLDLNMPVLDGYQVLESLAGQTSKPQTIVVSADIQDKARELVFGLGAADFISKPIHSDELDACLRKLGIDVSAIPEVHTELKVSIEDALREVSNVAMGRTASLLAKVIDNFVHLPVPKVSHWTPQDLEMTLMGARQDQNTQIISQGYIGSGIAGEALLLFHDINNTNLSQLFGIQGYDLEQQDEVLLDAANLLFGAFLNSLSEQLHVAFSQSPPVIWRRSQTPPELKGEVFAIEISYRQEQYNLNCDLLLLLPQSSWDKLQQYLSVLL